MPKLSPTVLFTRTLDKLLTDRKQIKAEIGKLQEKLNGIDSLFAEYGIHLDGAEEQKPAKRKGGWPKGKPRGKAGTGRKRGVFETTAHEFVLGLLKGKTLTTAEVNAAWKKEGRGAFANTTLTQLVQAKKVRRESLKEGKGSKYSLS